MNTQKLTFHVHGMHCKSCVMLNESELIEIPEVFRVRANLKHRSVEVEGDFGQRDPATVAKDLSRVLEPHGYRLSVEKQVHDGKWNQFKIAGPIALGFIGLFILLQKLGIVNLVSTGDIGYGTVFIVGVIASLSTCMAVVGGLVLSISANYAKEGDKVRPQALFHIGRLISFFLLGGMIGALGSAFELGGTGTFILSLLVAIVLLMLGINLLDVFPTLKKLQPTLPQFVSKRALAVKKVNHVLTPLILGVVTFFLPCGFTQSMQIYTLSTGNFMEGALTMFVYALGTLPVLLILSFTSLGIHGKANRGVFFKTAGLVVIFFAVFNLINSLVVVGLIPPIWNI